MVLSDYNEGENSYRRLTENLPGIVYRVLIEEDNRTIFFNDMVQTITGYNPEDLKRGEVCSIYPIILPEDRLNVINIVKDAIENNVPFEVEYRINNKSGDVKWFSERGRPIRGDNGNPSYIDGVIFDITKQKEAEQKLIESETKFKTIYNESPIGIELYDSNGKLVNMNECGLDIFGISHIDDVRGFDLFKDPNVPKEHLIKLKKGQIIRHEILFDFDLIKDLNLYKTKRSGKIWIDVLISPLYLEGNNTISNYLVQLQEITERIITEQKLKVLNEELDQKIHERSQQLKKSEEKYKSLFEQTPMAMILINFDGIIEDCNTSTEILFGYTKEELLGKEYLKFGNFPLDTKLILAKSFSKFLKTRVAEHSEIQMYRKDGKIIWINSYPINVKIDEKSYILAAIQDTTERKKIDQILKESQKKYKLLSKELELILDHILGLVFYKDTKNSFIWVNKYMADAYKMKREDLIGKSLFELYPEDVAQTNWDDDLEVINSGKPKLNIEEPWDTADGLKWVLTNKMPYIDENGDIKGIIGTSLDITEHKIAEQKLREAQKKTESYLNLAGTGILALNKEGVIALLNKKGHEILQYNEGELIGKNWFETCLPEQRKIEFFGNFKKLLKGDVESVEYVEDLVITKTGEERIIAWYNTLLYDNERNIVGTLSSGDDITERKKTELKIKESEEKFRKQNVFLNNILKSLTHPFYVINVKDYTVALANSSASSEGLEHGECCYSLTHGNNKPCEVPCMCPLDEVKKTKRACVVEHTHYDKKGNEKIYEIYGYPILDDSGNVVQMIEYALNITDRKKVERELKESEEKYRDLFESSPISLWEEDFSELKNYIEILKNSGIKDFRVYFDKNPGEVKKCVSMIKIVDINKKTLELYKANKKEDFFAGLDKVFTEESLDTFKEQIISLTGGKNRFESEAINCTFNGDKLYIYIECEMVAGFEEDWSKILVSIVDISERKKAEKKLIESEEKFRTIAERTLMGILIIQDNLVKYANEALLNMFEYSQKEIANWEKEDLTKLIHPEDLKFLREYREHLRSGDKSLKPYYSYRALSKSGKVKWIDQFSKEIQYKGRSAELVTIMDITEKKEAEQELVKLSNLKSELLRRTSHELKTPLVSIKGFSDLLLELHRDKLDDYVIKTIKQIKGGCSRLESLVNDILKTAELESGTVKLKKSKEDLSLLIKTCVSELEGLSELRNHSINLAILDKLVCSFEKEQIYNVITNILINAINFTPYNGKIEVKSEIKNDFIIISIMDNGIGFTEEEKTQIFKQFGKIERYGQGYDVISEGSGLGLYISKKIVELHGGKIWLESEGRNKGSTFIVSLPLDEK